MTKRKILLYQGGRYFSTEKTYKYFKSILKDYIVEMYENIDIFASRDFFDYSTTRLSILLKMLRNIKTF